MVERKNRTLIEAGRTMLEEANLPTYFWKEAINTACFTQNCTLINRHGVTPYQSLKRKKPSLKHLHIFGYKCFVLRTHPKQLGKFEAKADEGIFVGYPLTTRVYRVFNLRTRYIVESINVSFDDGKIIGFDDDNLANLEFENDQITVDDPSEPDKSNTDEINTYEDVNAHFQGEHVQNDISHLLSSSTEDSDETENTDDSSNSDGTSNADEGLQSAESTENNVENTISWGASEDTQENSLDDLIDAGGASSSRLQLPPARKWTKDHTPELIIGNPEAGVQTRSATQNECLFHNFLSQEKPKKVEDALKDSDWVTAMQEELNEFERNKV